MFCQRKLDSNQIYVYKYQDIYIFVLAFAMFSDRNFEGPSDIQFCHVFSQHHDIFNRYGYMCDRKILIVSMVLNILMLVYEFFVSISPVGPKKPSWTFMNVETTANSLSQSNYFNLFVIFLDALIVVIYDVNRSKYVMMVKKCKREILEVSPSKEYNLKRLWICVAVTGFLSVTTFIMEESSKIFSRIHPGLENIVLGIMGSICICCYLVILYFSSGS